MSEKFDKAELGELTAEINRALRRTDVAGACATIGSAVKLHNASEIARKAGIERPSIYRAFGSAGSPNFSTVVKVLAAMGLRLKVTKDRGPTRQRTIKANRARVARVKISLSAIRTLGK
ncbi:MAG TPA: putative addiction module antidote protein [Bradyrhizobium sp.]|nr:putative addiction module antidote protein [Bradyrhizobium sp.]